MQHFTDDNVAFLSYHLADPALDPLVNDLALARAAELGGTGPDRQIIDGIIPQPGAGKWRDAEEIYDRTRKAVLLQLKMGTDFELDMEVEYVAPDPNAMGPASSGRIAGWVSLEGPEDADLSVHCILAERGVLFPGGSGVVVHRMVARAELLSGTTGDQDGALWEPENEFMEVAFDMGLDSVQAANEACLDRLMNEGAGTVRKLSMKLDARQLMVVAFVKDNATGEVLQALVVEPEGLEELRNASE